MPTTVTFRYDEPIDETLRLTLRITLATKYLDGPASGVVSLITNYYNDKFPAATIDGDNMCLKIVGGAELLSDSTIRGALKDGDQVYLLPKEMSARKKPEPCKVEPEIVVQARKKIESDGRLRCKRFGCTKFYVEGSEDLCVHHKSPPIFHETAKYWSCCSNKKAYDWEEFERIPGCVEIIGHTQEAAKKKFLGGTDLRAQNTPERIDGGYPSDPRKQLDMLRAALLAMGGDEEFFDRVWGRLAAKYGDLRIVAEEVRKAVEESLEKVSMPSVDMPDD